MNKYHIYKFLYNLSFKKNMKFKKKMEKYKRTKLDEMSYDYNRLAGAKVRNDYSFDPELTGLVAYQTLNKIKELDLKRKIRDGKKVKVCFLIDDIAKFTAQSVYKEMEHSELFEPYILLYDHKDGYFSENIIYENHIKGLDYLKSRHYKVFDCFDKDKNFIPLETFKPDIIIMTSPYLDYHNTVLTNIFLNINYLVCYLSYGFDVSNSYTYHYNNRRIASCWKNFVPTKEDYTETVKYSKYCGTNCILTGFPKLDVYKKPISECIIPEKIDNGKPIVIYAPHHSIRNDWEPVNLATFHLYYNYFLNLAKNTPDINFVLKPHPNLVLSVVEQGIMSQNEYQQYIETWNSLPNGLYVYDGEYIDLFRRSDLLIQDSGSFIGEWLPTDKPCIYLVNPERNQKTYMDGFSVIGRKILEKYYLAHNQEEIDKYFKMIMFDKKDSLKEERIKLKDEMFINIGCAGQKITDYLTEILTD